MAGGKKYGNDKFELKDLPADILEALDFWAVHTPDESALKVPRGLTSLEGYETVTWWEFQQLRNRMGSWLTQALGIQAPADITSPVGARTITFLITPTHEVIIPWIALASMGYTVQFISPAHQPDTVCSLIERAGARVIFHYDMEPSWFAQLLVQLTQVSLQQVPNISELSEHMRINPLLKIIRDEQPNKTPCQMSPFPTLHTVKPVPFVFLHSFGSTARPKLYPIAYEAANSSAVDSAYWALQLPPKARWRVQLQTSLAFHFSFQNPVWRALKCGTAVAYPIIDPRTKRDRAERLVPNPADILESLDRTGSNLLYCSPSGLQAVLELAHHRSSPIAWRMAIAKLDQAHTGAAPVSQEKADCYDRYGLLVFQVFALTETGLMFFGRKDITGDTTWLKPLPSRREHMLFCRIPDTDVYQLWVKDTFPDLAKHGVHFEPFPGDFNLMAWNTGDTFRRLPPTELHDDLCTFAGRLDDWIRCTHGTAARAIELEDVLLRDLRQELGYETIKAVTVIGNGRADLGAVIEFSSSRDAEEPSDAALKCVLKCTQYMNEKLLIFPAVLKPTNVIYTCSKEPIFMTQKGSLMRSQNEAYFGPKLDLLLTMTQECGSQ